MCDGPSFVLPRLEDLAHQGVFDFEVLASGPSPAREVVDQKKTVAFWWWARLPKETDPSLGLYVFLSFFLSFLLVRAALMGIWKFLL